MLAGPEPAASFEDRYGYSPGQDIRSEPQKAGRASKAHVYTEDAMDADRNRRQTALAVRLALASGRAGDENGNVRAAREMAAMQAEAAKAGTYVTAEDPTPGRKVDTRGVAGFTAGYGGGR